MSNPLWLKRIDRAFHRPGAWIGGMGSLAFSFRTADSRPLILRPGGMGDLIFLTIAMEEMGLDPKGVLWLIELRSEVWARHLGLEYLCYDRSAIKVHFQIAGRFKKVLNTEQRFGLAQATALLARARGGRLWSFDTNVGAAAADEKISYDAYQSHETVEFSRILHAALGGTRLDERPVRRRKAAPSSPVIVGIGGLQSETRKLSEAQWLAFIEAFAGSGPVEIARAPVDRDFASALASKVGSRAAVFEGDFEELCQRIAGAEQVLTIDSGFQHLAAYYGVPTTTIFTSSRATKWAPLAEGSRVVRRTDLGCQPCALYAQVPPCPHGYVCREVDFRKDVKPA